MAARVFLYCLFFIFSKIALAQDPGVGQYGLRLSLHKSVDGKFLLSNYLGFRDEFKDSEKKWTRIAWTSETSFFFGPHFELQPGFSFMASRENSAVSTREFSPYVIGDIKLNLKSRFFFKSEVQLKNRNIFYREASQSDHALVLRGSLGSRISLNQKNIFEDNNFILLSDAYGFLPLQDIAQTYFDQFQFRLGLIYRQSFSWRYEFIYSWSNTRNTIEEKFSRSVNLFEFRLKYFISSRLFKQKQKEIEE